MRILAGCLLASLASTAWADELSIPHERYSLDNGLDVVLAQDNSAPIVHVQLWYHVGSKDETKGLTGFAHLFEHLMFQGSKNAPGEYFTPIQQVGGDLNGTTNPDRTNYYETVPSRYLPLALFMESDRMGNLLPVLDQGKLDNQRDVVRNERRQRVENPPYGEAWSDLMAAMYPEGHPYHHPTIGSHEDLENASLEDVTDFFKKWYGPNNATLVVVGDFEMDTARALVEENFGWIPATPEPERRVVEPVALTESSVMVQYDDVPQQKVWIAWHSPAFHQPGDAEMDLAASMLCGGKDSRVYKALVKKQKVARDVGCFQVSSKLQSTFVFTATAAEGHSTEEVVEAFEKRLSNFLSDEGKRPTDSEFEAAKADYEVGFYGRIETIQGKGSTMSSYIYFTGEPDHLQEDLDRYMKADVDGVMGAARDVLSGPSVQLHIKPKSEEGK